MTFETFTTVAVKHMMSHMEDGSQPVSKCSNPQTKGAKGPCRAIKVPKGPCAIVTVRALARDGTRAWPRAGTAGLTQDGTRRPGPGWDPDLGPLSG